MLTVVGISKKIEFNIYEAQSQMGDRRQDSANSQLYCVTAQFAKNECTVNPLVPKLFHDLPSK